MDATFKTKDGEKVAAAFKSIFKLGRKPKKLWVDKGREFYNKNARGILGKTTMYSNENEEKSSVVKRWKRTMKENMCKYFYTNATRKYIDKMMEKYNNTRHSSIKMVPVQASLKKNEAAVWMILYGNKQRVLPKLTPKFSVGDRVRITRKKNIFEKRYTPRWTDEVFTISSIQYTDPPTYKIADFGGEEIHGTFYEQELQETSHEIYMIEKVIRKRGNRSLVKWLGYPESFNSWVDNRDLIKLKKQR